MEHKMPPVRSIAFFVLGAFGLAFAIALLIHYALFAGLLLAMACIAIFQGIRGIRQRNTRPLTVADGKLTFWRGAKQVVVETDGITKIWYNTKGIDKRVTIALRSGEEVDIPVVYGLAPLARKLNKHLGLS